MSSMSESHRLFKIVTAPILNSFALFVHVVYASTDAKAE